MINILKGDVIHGKKLGRTIGFPTANILLSDSNIEDGVYKVNIVINRKTYHGAASSSQKKGLFEIYIFDFNEDIYGKNIKIIIFDKIRDNKVFNSKKELKEQIKIDIATIKNIKDYVLTFGTFDVIHPGHEYFLKNAKKYGDRLVTIVATGKNVKRFKNHKAENKLEQRMQDVKDLHICDIVSPGNEDNPLIWIKLYVPKVICLGYDQESFTQILEKYIKKEKLEIYIKRIKAFKQDTFKSSILKTKKKKDSF